MVLVDGIVAFFQLAENTFAAKVLEDRV